MTGTTEAAREIDRVLDGLRGHDLFRKNAFRVTGLALDATARQVRRAREESRNAYYLPPEAADAPLPPSTDPVELRAAFEVLQDPVARLVHELLWVGDSGDARDGDARDQAVRALCRALEATSQDGTVLTETAWGNWRKGLRSWAEAMRLEATWAQARRRAEEIDDPRVTVALVRTLRQRLPAHLVGVTVGVATAAAVRESGMIADTTGRLVRTLREAGFDAGDVRSALRTAAQPFVDRIRAACEVARTKDAATSGVVAARELLDTAAKPMGALDKLLGKDDDLAVGNSDDIALTMNNCLVGFANDNDPDSDGVAEALIWLDAAVKIADSPSMQERIQANYERVSNNLHVAVRARRGTAEVRTADVLRDLGLDAEPSFAGPASGSPAGFRGSGPFGASRRSHQVGIWRTQLLFGLVPAAGAGFGAAALGLAWFWFAAVPLVVAFYVALVHHGWSWADGSGRLHLRLLVLPAGLTWLITALLGGGPVDGPVLAALVVSIVVATVKERL